LQLCRDLNHLENALLVIQGNSFLTQAKQGNLAKVKKYLDGGCDIETKNLVRSHFQRMYQQMIATVCFYLHIKHIERSETFS
jgi:hypothetical protein